MKLWTAAWILSATLTASSLFAAEADEDGLISSR